MQSGKAIYVLKYTVKSGTVINGPEDEAEQIFKDRLIGWSSLKWIDSERGTKLLGPFYFFPILFSDIRAFSSVKICEIK